MDKDGTDINDNDRQARRLFELALAFVNATRPLSSSELRRLYYPEVGKESFRKVFLRDRKKLALCGLIIRRVNKQPDEPLWQVDPSRSYAKENVLDDDEAQALDLACAPLASDPSFPYADDLRLALAKIDHYYDTSNRAQVISKTSSRSGIIVVAEQCYTNLHVAKVSYRRRDGLVLDRRIAIYGFFSLRDAAYVVAASIIPDEGCGIGSIHTYRIDRFLSIEEDNGISYVLPDDFCITDYVLLPFQLGPTLYYAQYSVPECQVDRIKSLSYGRGVWNRTESSWVWCIDVSSEQDAASWAISEGIVPLSPQSLIHTWRTTLEGCLQYEQ